jgi:hypothetical protein
MGRNILLQNKLTHSHKTSRKFRAEQYWSRSDGGKLSMAIGTGNRAGGADSQHRNRTGPGRGAVQRGRVSKRWAEVGNRRERREKHSAWMWTEREAGSALSLWPETQEHRQTEGAGAVARARIIEPLAQEMDRDSPELAELDVGQPRRTEVGKDC